MNTTMEKRILITGVNGFLGSRLLEYFREREGYETIGITHRELEISDSLAVSAFLRAIRPDCVLHCAGVSNTGECEQDPERSERINVNGTANVAKACKNVGSKMIFMSSDQVYNASCTLEPNREDRVQRPGTVYGRDKKRAEEAMFTHLTDAVALRLTWMYDYPVEERPGGSGLLGILISALKDRSMLKLPVHDYRGITYVWEAVRNIEAALKLPGGIYNFGSENSLSTYDTAVRFLTAVTGKDKFDSILTPDTERFASCPRNLTIDTGRIKEHGIAFSDTLESIRNCLSEYPGRSGRLQEMKG